MNEERLQTLLGSLRAERMDRIADDRIRDRLENAWSAREATRGLGWGVRRIAPALATLVLFAGVTAATLGASGDSALYGVRIAIEDAAANLRADPQDRAEYLVALLDQRQAEAARLEATGNAAAASRVRAAEENTLRALNAILPEAPDEVPVVEAPSPTPDPTPSPTPEPTASPSPSPTLEPTATPRPPTSRPTPTPTRTATPTVRATTPAPVPTGTPFAVTFSGRVKNADGTLADGVCVRLDPSSPSCLKLTSGGLYSITASARINQTVTIYFTRQDGAILYKAFVSMVVKSASVTMPDARLQK